MNTRFAGAFPLWGSRFRLERGAPGVVTIVRLEDETVVGGATLEEYGDELFIRSICIEPAHRSYGAGSEAAWLLVNAGETAGFARLRAWAAPNLGLSVYFWTRMGFHPVHGEGPEGGIWFERVVERA